MIRISMLFTAVSLLVACESRTVVYTSPATSRPVAYSPSPRTRTVTNTVYVERQADYPTAIPGESKRLPDPGDPSRFPAVSQ